MKKRRVLLISSLLAVSAFAWGVQDQGQLSLAARQEQRSKVFNDGRSLVAYHQSGTMVGGSARGPWKKATLFAQGTVFKDAAGALVAEVALWEAADPEGDLVWGVLWRPKDAPSTLEIKAGTGKWKGIAGKGRLLDGESRRHDVRLGGQGSRRYHASPFRCRPITSANNAISRTGRCRNRGHPHQREFPGRQAARAKKPEQP